MAVMRRIVTSLTDDGLAIRDLAALEATGQKGDPHQPH
jgi:hypothetical protein